MTRIPLPRSPFSTPLSGSAKEAEERIRNIFQYKKKRPPILGLAAACALALLCGGLVSCQPVRQSFPTLVMDTQYYDSQGNYIEIPALAVPGDVEPDEGVTSINQALAELKAEGVRRTVMLTGDALPVAQAVQTELGVDEVHAGLLPGDKVEQVERLLADKRPKEQLVFVGDGINDAPVLSRADIGVAMGAMGSDAAIEAADIVLMDDDLTKLALAVRIARKTLRIVRENIVFALGVKAVVLLLSAIGMANMWMAVFADVGVSVIAILNASRMLKGDK